MLRASTSEFTGGTSLSALPVSTSVGARMFASRSRVSCRAIASTCAVAKRSAVRSARSSQRKALSGCAACHSAETRMREMRAGVTNPRLRSSRSSFVPSAGEVPFRQEAKVHPRARARTRSGCRIASSCATIPPIEMPNTCAAGAPDASITDAASAARSRMW